MSCGESSLKSKSVSSVSSTPAPVVVEKFNVAKVTGYSGSDYYIKYKDGDVLDNRISAREYVKAGSTNWNVAGNFYFRSMTGFQKLKTLPNSLRKAR